MSALILMVGRAPIFIFGGYVQRCFIYTYPQYRLFFRSGRSLRGNTNNICEREVRTIKDEAFEQRISRAMFNLRASQFFTQQIRSRSNFSN